VHALSVFREAWEWSAAHCGDSANTTTAPTCVLSTVPTARPPWAAPAAPATLVPLATRLVDVCATLMAHEGTCHHSDHSIGRCLIYGAYADPVNSGCHSTAPAGNPMRDPFDMADPTGVKVPPYLAPI